MIYIKVIFGVYSCKLWLCLALGAFVFASGCKHANNDDGQKPISNEITITVKGDDDVIINKSNTIRAKKSSSCKEIKNEAIKKIISKKSKEIKEWRIKNAQGVVLKDADTFEKDETIFAVTKRKVVGYKMEHLQENIEDDCFTVKDTEDKTGEAGKDTTAEAKQYECFKVQSFS